MQPGPELDAAIAREWDRLAKAGTWLTAAERVGIATVARSPAAEDGSVDAARDLDHPSALAASLVAHRPATITRETVDGFEAEGLGRQRYLEIVGVVSRLVAIDTFERGIGRPIRPLPVPVEGAPTREAVPEAKQRAGWVPTVGPIGPPSALNSVPAEAAAQEDLHGALYLTYDGMVDLAVVRDLSRVQMELVAARVSFANDCLF